MKRKSLLSAAVVSALLAAGSAYAGEMTLFAQPNFRGGDMTLTGEASNFERTGFNDQAASLIVRSGRWEVCSDAHFAGQCAVLGPGEYPMLRDPIHRRISSAREIVSHASAEPLYYREQQARVYEPARVHDPVVIDDRSRYSALELYTLPGFRGSTMKFDRSGTTLDRRNTDEGIASLVVREGVWELCTGLDFNGTCRTFEPGRYGRLGSFEGAPVGSLRRIG